MLKNGKSGELLPRIVLFFIFAALLVTGGIFTESILGPALGLQGMNPEAIQVGAKAGTSDGLPKGMAVIAVKFLLWFLAIIIAAILLRRKTLKRKERLLIYGFGTLLFGVLLGSEPSPMHPVKDFIVGLGISGKPVPLFLGFLAVLLILSIIINRSICAWGCQFGLLQDFIHRIFRNKKDTKSVVKAYKVPFMVTNTIRILFFLAIIIGAFGFSYDLLGKADPFRIFSPSSFIDPKGVGIIAAVFTVILLIASVFVYRPFCYFFCPFGLLGWLASRLSIVRIRVNRDLCTECGVCAKACPSYAMQGIYDEKRFSADCYTCGSCITSCPQKAITLSKKN